jgi:hypothetical protein
VMRHGRTRLRGDGSRALHPDRASGRRKTHQASEACCPDGGGGVKKSLKLTALQI